MNQLVPFEAQLPAHLSTIQADINDDLTSNIGVGYPVLSIKGKVWHLVQGEERRLLTQPGTADPLSSIEVVIVAANPHLSKVYYASGYVEGSTEKPDCFSGDGITPDASVDSPQHTSCATCPQNAWGSKITEAGKKAKACADSRRMAVAAQQDLSAPMLLRVPAASLKDLALYSTELKKRGAPVTGVVTKIGFDYTVAHPQLTFKPVGFLSAADYAKVMELRSSALVQQIIAGSAAGDFVATPAPAPAVQAALAVKVQPHGTHNPNPAPVAQRPVAAVPAERGDGGAPKRRGRPAKSAAAGVSAGDSGAGDAQNAQPSPVAVAPVAAGPAKLTGVEADVGDILSDLGLDD